MRPIVIFLWTAAMFLLSCKKDQRIESVSNKNDSGSNTTVNLKFKAKINNKDVTLSQTERFINAIPGDTFTVDRLDYYITNVKLKSVDGYTFAENESYHLVRHDDTPSTSFTLSNMKEGYYSSIEFLIGVDSTRNVSGAQTGYLDPAYNMFWGWNSGYIFIKVEGDFTSNNNSNPLPYNIHIGGFSGSYNCIRKCDLSFPELLDVTSGKQNALELEVNLDKFFTAEKNIDLTSYSSITIGKKAWEIANNYEKMFSVVKVVN